MRWDNLGAGFWVGSRTNGDKRQQAATSGDKRRKVKLKRKTIERPCLLEVRLAHARAFALSIYPGEGSLIEQ